MTVPAVTDAAEVFNWIPMDLTENALHPSWRVSRVLSPTLALSSVSERSFKPLSIQGCASL